MDGRLVKINKLILFLITIIFILIFVFNRIYIYSQTLTEEEKGKYTALVNYIKDIYRNVRLAISLYYSYNSRNFSRVLWSDLAYYEKSLPNINSKVYNDPRGLIITLWGTDDYKYFASAKNGLEGSFAIEVNISNTVAFKDKKYIYYLLDGKIDSFYDLSRGKVVTGKAGLNPLISSGEIQNLGDDSNYSSIYILVY